MTPHGVRAEKESSMTVPRRRRNDLGRSGNDNPSLLRYIQALPRLLFAAATFVAAVTALIAEVFVRG
jgi:hypothetical protein